MISTGNYLFKKTSRSVLLIAVVLVALSCATKSSSYKEIDFAVEQNNFSQAVAAIEAGQELTKPIYPEKNAIMLFLDKGLLEHYAGNYSVSSNDLQRAERLIEEAYTKSVTQNLTSYLANDNTKDYPGEDFEDIYLNVFNALNYYNRGDLEGALVEIRKLTFGGASKLVQLNQRYEEDAKNFGEKAAEQFSKIGFLLSEELPRPGAIEFSNSALARYLATLFYLADGNTDSARIEYDWIQKAFDDNPNIYKNPKPKAITEIQTVPQGKARLHIIGFTGLSPVKEEERFNQFWPFMQNPLLNRYIFKASFLSIVVGFLFFQSNA